MRKIHIASQALMDKSLLYKPFFMQTVLPTCSTYTMFDANISKILNVFLNETIIYLSEKHEV